MPDFNRGDAWSSAFGSMMRRHAGRSALTSLECHASCRNAFPGDEPLVTAVRRLVEEYAGRN